MWDEITYLSLNFNGLKIEVWEWISNFIQAILYNGRDVDKGGPGYLIAFK